MLSKDKTTLYACTTPGIYNISKYEKCKTMKTWEKTLDLPRFQNDENEIMLQLKLDRNDQFLFGEYYSQCYASYENILRIKKIIMLVIQIISFLISIYIFKCFVFSKKCKICFVKFS